MAWIADVAPFTTIQSLWGNSIRDRVVHTFATVAERDAQAHPLDGMLCETASDRRLWQYRGDLAKWIIVNEPWQGWAPSATAGTTPVGIQADLAESRMQGDQVTARFLLKAVGVPPAAPGGIYFSLPPTRGNLAPEQTPAGCGTATIFATGLSYGVIFYTEFGRIFARRMSDLTSIGAPGGGGDIAMTGTITYRSNGYGP